MPLGLGLTKGASFVNNWEGDIDRLYKREEYAAQVRAEKERKTQFYAQQLKQGHASNPRTEKELDDYYTGLNSELANFVTENPNFESDVAGMTKFMNISDKYLNNDILQRDLQVKNEFEKMQNAAASGSVAPSVLRENQERYNAYINPNNIGKDNAFVFSNPKITTSSDILKEMRGMVVANPVLNPKTGLPDIKIDPLTHLRYSQDVVPFDEHMRAAGLMYTDPDNKFVMDDAYQRAIEDSKKPSKAFPNGLDLTKEYPDAVTYMAKLNQNQTKTEFHNYGESQDYLLQKKFEFEQQMKRVGMTDFYEENLAKPLMKLGLNESMPANKSSAALTEAHETNKPFFITGKTGMQVIMNNDPKSGGGQPSLWDVPYQGKVLNITDHVNMGGRLYAKSTIEFNIPEKRNEDDSTIDENYLKDRGFTSGQIVDASFWNDITKKDEYRKARVWTGTGYLPEIHNAENKYEYNKSVAGEAEATKISSAYGSTIEAPSGKQTDMLKSYVYNHTGKNYDIQTSELDPGLSRENGAETYVVKLGDGKEYALNKSTGELRNIVYK